MPLLKETLDRFLDDRCPQLAAALSFYAVFSLPALLVLVLMAAGIFVSAEQLQARLIQEISLLMGSEAARQIQSMIDQARLSAEQGALTLVLGTAALAYGATRAFAQLQTALNVIWGIERDRGIVEGFVVKRLMSFAMVLLLAFLLVASLAVSAVLRVVSEMLGGQLPVAPPAFVFQALPSLLSLLVLPPFFAAVFVFLPDAEVAWRDVWVGAAVTTVLFEVGKLGIGFYLARMDPGAAYGAAGALALVMMWVYYSSMTLFVGAEFTQAWAARRGRGFQPRDGQPGG